MDEKLSLLRDYLGNMFLPLLFILDEFVVVEAYFEAILPVSRLLVLLSTCGKGFFVDFGYRGS